MILQIDQVEELQKEGVDISSQMTYCDEDYENTFEVEVSPRSGSKKQEVVIELHSDKESCFEFDSDDER
jgi:hypothetical protein